jgi:hypothetical protein
MAEETPDPDDRASDFEAMQGYWEAVEAFLDGADAVKAKGNTFLPKFPNESDADYKDRLDNGKFTAILSDIVADLAEKPFAKELTFANAVPREIEDLADDIDGLGNNMHVFAANQFFWSVANALDFILVDKTPVKEGATVAEERAAGARPYWVRIPATSMIAAYTAMIDGREQFVHVRFEENTVERQGFSEVKKERVRVFNREPLADGTWGPATYELWEEQKDKVTGKEVWVQILPPTRLSDAMTAIPLVPVVLGKRHGTTWRLIPPMRPIVHLQTKHYQGETNLEYAKNLTAAPMLTASGVTPPTRTRTITVNDVVQNIDEPVPVPVGPKTVLYAPPDPNGGAPGEWKFIEISATSLKFLAEEVDRTEQQMRELGRQPLKAQTGLTVISAARSGQKAASAVQAWAMLYKDALELAWAYTVQWMGRSDEVEVSVYTDFGVGMESDKAPDFLLELRRTGDISRTAIIAEAKRRDFLSAEYDPDEDLQVLLDEMPSDSAADALPPDPNPGAI